MSQESPLKRFIAGATCPRCGVQDRIRTFVVDGQTQRECVACGFADILGADAAPAPPPGRLDGPRQPAAGAAQPLRFHPPKPRRKPPTTTGDDDSSQS